MSDIKNPGNNNFRQVIQIILGIGTMFVALQLDFQTEDIFKISGNIAILVILAIFVFLINRFFSPKHEKFHDLLSKIIVSLLVGALFMVILTAFIPCISCSFYQSVHVGIIGMEDPKSCKEDISPRGNYVDNRDGQNYPWVRLKNGNIWMSQNLKYKMEQGSWSYNNDPQKEQKYGRLYTWEAAKHGCPTGWQLPTDEDWSDVISSFGGNLTAFTELIKGGNSGFDAEYGGVWTHELEEEGDEGSYWSSSPNKENNEFAITYDFNAHNNNLFRRTNRGKQVGRSVRCIKK